MRRLFIVLAKLLGLLQIYRGIIILAFISQSIFSSGHPHAGQFGSMAIHLILFLGMAWLLLFRTEWLADMLKIGDDGEAKELNDDVILRNGVKLIGVFVVVSAFPELVKPVLRWIITDDYTWSVSNYAWVEAILPLLKLGLGIFLVAKTDKVLSLITKNDKTVDFSGV